MPFEAPSPVRSRAVTFSIGTTLTYDYPETVVSGDRLVAVIGVDTVPTLTVPGDWTILSETDNGVDTTLILHKEADGSEGGTTFSVGSSLSRGSGGIVYAIPAGGVPTLSLAGGNSTVPNPPTHSPGAGEYLWLVGAIANDANGQFVTDWPTEVGGWTQPVELAASGAQSVITAAAERLLTASSFDPGTLLLNAARDWVAFNISVPVTVTAGDYPVVEGVAESPWASASTSQTMNLPAGIQAGNLLVAEIGTTGAPTIAITDWTTLLGPSGSDGNERGAVLYKVADGTESGTVTVTLGSSQSGAAVCRRISGADATKIDGAINPATASTTITPPALTPADGSDAILWLVGYTYDVSGIPVSPWPFNFATAGAFVSKDSGLISGMSALTVASVTPSSFTLPVSRRTISWTVAIYPAVSVQTIAVTGLTETETLGTLTATVTAPITGLTETGTLGTLTAAVTAPVTGLVETETLGTVVRGAQVESITGLTETETLGTVTAVTTAPVVGLTETETLGTLTAVGAAPIVGLTETETLGVVVGHVTGVVVGLIETETLGTIGATTTADLTGLVETEALANLIRLVPSGRRQEGGLSATHQEGGLVSSAQDGGLSITGRNG